MKKTLSAHEKREIALRETLIKEMEKQMLLLARLIGIRTMEIRDLKNKTNKTK